MKPVLSTLALLAALAAPAPGFAQQDGDAPVVEAQRIIKALQTKDIVLDQPGQVVAAIDLQVQFAFDSARLRPQGKRQLDELAFALNDKGFVTSGFELAGHTDMVGSEAYNKRLSLQRAQAVKAYLVEVHGIAPTRLQTIGLGFERLADTGNPRAAINRRVEVRRIAMQVPTTQVQPMRRSGGRLVPTPQ